jgi:hypothetical protein
MSNRSRIVIVIYHLTHRGQSRVTVLRFRVQPACISIVKLDVCFNRMESDNDLLLRHVRHFYVDSRGDISCNDQCRIGHICGLRNSAHDDHLFCVEAASSQPNLTSSATPTATNDTTSAPAGTAAAAANTTATNDSGHVTTVTTTSFDDTVIGASTTSINSISVGNVVTWQPFIAVLSVAASLLAWSRCAT